MGAIERFLARTELSAPAAFHEKDGGADVLLFIVDVDGERRAGREHEGVGGEV